jgi:hypothetical protein
VSPGIVLACVGEERRSATAKGEECGHGRNRFVARLKRNAVKGSKLKNSLLCLERDLKFRVFLITSYGTNASWYGMI